MSCCVSVSAVTPINSWNSEYAVRSHSTLIKHESTMAPMGSSHHLSLLPPMEVIIPKPLMMRSLRWSSQRMRIWLYCFRRAQQYRNRLNFVQNATATATTEGRWKLRVLLLDPVASSRHEKAIKMNDTAVIKKQKTMLPAVSIRAFPAGYFRASTVATALLLRRSVKFDSGSKIASAMVVNRESDPDEMAPYSCRMARRTLATNEPYTAI